MIQTLSSRTKINITDWRTPQYVRTGLNLTIQLHTPQTIARRWDYPSCRHIITPSTNRCLCLCFSSEWVSISAAGDPSGKGSSEGKRCNYLANQKSVQDFRIGISARNQPKTRTKNCSAKQERSHPCNRTCNTRPFSCRTDPRAKAKSAPQISPARFGY